LKFVVLADIHLTRFSQDKIEKQTNYPERLYSILQCLNEVTSFCREHRIFDIVIAGDTMHTKSVIYSLAQNVLLDYLDSNKSFHFYIIDGNHDLSGKGSDVVSALRALKNVSNVTWIPYTETFFQDKMNTLFIPYSSNVVEHVKSNTSKILISHFGLNEGVLNSGISVISDLKLSDLRDRYNLVILGHYHKPQEIIDPKISVYYVGSLIQLDWGEKGDDKRFLVVDTDSLEVQSILLRGYKRHVELEVTRENKDEIMQVAKKERDDGNYVKIVLKEKIDVSEPDFIVVDKSERDVTNRGISSSMSQGERFKKYLEIREVPTSKHELYLQIAKAIVDQSTETH